MRFFIAIFFEIAKDREQSKYPSVGDWLNKSWYSPHGISCSHKKTDLSKAHHGRQWPPCCDLHPKFSSLNTLVHQQPVTRSSTPSFPFPSASRTACLLALPLQSFKAWFLVLTSLLPLGVHSQSCGLKYHWQAIGSQISLLSLIALVTPYPTADLTSPFGWLTGTSRSTHWKPNSWFSSQKLSSIPYLSERQLVHAAAQARSLGLSFILVSLSSSSQCDIKFCQLHLQNLSKTWSSRHLHGPPIPGPVQPCHLLGPSQRPPHWSPCSTCPLFVSPELVKIDLPRICHCDISELWGQKDLITFRWREATDHHPLFQQQSI